MDTAKDTKMQLATDAVIDNLRKLQATAWVYEDMLGRKCVGFERPLHRRNTHEPLFSAATHAVVMGLVNRLEEAEKEIALKERVIDALGSKLNAVAKECDTLLRDNTALRAKIEAMEKQVPYCWTTSPPSGHYSRFNPEVDRWIENGWTVVPLYALPGAQPDQSVPDGWQLVPVEPTEEMIDKVIDERLAALVSGKDHSMLDIYRAMLAAAPETKP